MPAKCTPWFRRIVVHLLLWPLEHGPIARWLDGDDCLKCSRVATALRVEDEVSEAARLAECPDHSVLPG